MINGLGFVYSKNCLEYVNTVQASNNPSEAIQENMWMLNLLSDKKYLEQKQILKTVLQITGILFLQLVNYQRILEKN